MSARHASSAHKFGDTVQPGHGGDRAWLAAAGARNADKCTAVLVVVKDQTGARSSGGVHNIEVAMAHNAWATTAKNKQRLDAAFEAYERVYLLFATRTRAKFHGLALLRSKFDRQRADVRWHGGTAWSRAADVAWLCRDAQLVDIPPKWHRNDRMMIDGSYVPRALDVKMLLHAFLPSLDAHACDAATMRCVRDDARLPPDLVPSQTLERFFQPVRSSGSSAAAAAAASAALAACTSACGSSDSAPREDATAARAASPPVQAVEATFAHAKYARHFLRPPYAGDASLRGRALEFFITDMSTCNSITERWALRERYHTGSRALRRNYWSFYVRLFGVTAAGHSVCAYVGGWTPYIYVRVPDEWGASAANAFAAHLREALAESDQRALAHAERNVTECTLTRRVPVFGYCGDARAQMLRVRFANAQTKRAAVVWLREHVRTAFRRPRYAGVYAHCDFALYDTTIDERQQFVNETGVSPSQWVRVGAHSYTSHNAPGTPEEHRRARTQIDVDVAAHGDIVVLDDRRHELPPLLIESWDIEAVRGARDDRFPQADVPGDEICQIGTSVQRYGGGGGDGGGGGNGDAPDDVSFVYQTVHCVRPTGPRSAAGADLNVFPTETDMLEHYMDFSVERVDADVKMTFNGLGFDNKYLDARLNKLLAPLNAALERGDDGDGERVDRGSGQGDFEYGRVRGRRSKCKDPNEGGAGATKAKGARDEHEVEMVGRVQLDLYKHASLFWGMHRKLDELARLELAPDAPRDGDDDDHDDDEHDAGDGDGGTGGDDDDDDAPPPVPVGGDVAVALRKLAGVTYREINAWYSETAAKRAHIAAYCRIDTELPLRIVHRRHVLIEYFAMSRLYGLPIDVVLNRKQGVRFWAILTRYGHRDGYAFPDDQARCVVDNPRLSELVFTGGYKGAAVLPPHKAFYTRPVATLDFASLYPSIMRGFRLCYTTIVLDERRYLPALRAADNVDRVEIEASDPSQPPYVVHYVRRPPREPLLYVILTELLSARSRAKRDRAAAEARGDSAAYDRYDKEQLVLKIGCNSVYGAIGAQHSRLPCVALAATVTLRGRQLLGTTRHYVEAHAPGATVVYGDSVSGDTPLCVRRRGRVHVVRIDDVARLIGRAWTPWHGTKESLELGGGGDGDDAVCVWSDGAAGGQFVRAVRFIRHRRAPHQRLWRVRTREGVVDVTDDHSLLRADGAECTVRELDVGATRLLHERDDAALLRALCDGDGGGDDDAVSAELAFAYGVCAQAAATNGGVGQRWLSVWLHDRDVLKRCAAALPFATTIESNAHGNTHQLRATDAHNAALTHFMRTFGGDGASVTARHVPDGVLCAREPAVAQAFVDGMVIAARTTMRGLLCEHRLRREHGPCAPKLLCAGVWLLWRRLAPARRMALHECDKCADKFHIVLSPSGDDTGDDGGGDDVVRDVRAVESDAAAFVYDVETASQHFAVAPGALVVHNTDSVMIDFNAGDDRAAFERAFVESKRLAAEITAHFGRPEIRLEFEKVFWPYVIWERKKNYAGIKYERPDEEGKFTKRGLPSVRRDKIAFVRRNVDALVVCMLKERSADGARRLLREQLDALVDDRLPPSDFRIEKLLKKPPGEYAADGGKAPQHVRVVNALAAKDANRAPKPGDIVAYVHVWDTHEQRRRADAMQYEQFVAQLHGAPLDDADAKRTDTDGAAATAATTTTTTTPATTTSAAAGGDYKPQYRIDKTYYLENLVQRVLGSFLDIEGFEPDPYRLFARYIARTKREDRGDAALSRFGFVRERSAATIAGGAGAAGAAASSGAALAVPKSALKRRLERAEQRKREKAAAERRGPRSKLSAFFAAAPPSPSAGAGGAASANQ